MLLTAGESEQGGEDLTGDGDADDHVTDVVSPRETPEQVLDAIVDGINNGNLDALMTLHQPDAGFASQPGTLAHGPDGVRRSPGRLPLR